MDIKTPKALRFESIPYPISRQWSRRADACMISRLLDFALPLTVTRRW